MVKYLLDFDNDATSAISFSENETWSVRRQGWDYSQFLCLYFKNNSQTDQNHPLTIRPVAESVS